MSRPLPIAFTCLPVALLLTGCGYVGEPLPPALRRPVPVTDLAVMEHGPKIVIQFTMPKVTTEDLPVTNADLELRVGPRGDSFDPGRWAASAERFTTVAIDKGIAKAEIDAAKYAGQTIAAGVNVHGPGGHSAGWSNFVALEVVPALQKPASPAANDAEDSVRLVWKGNAPEFRVFRKTVSAPEWERLGVAPGPSYTDSTIEYGQTYQYFVQAQQKAGETWAESEASDVVTIKPADHFAPAVPSGLTVVPATRSMELVWDRNMEKDFASYRIYRNGRLLPETVTSPAFSDPDVQTGVSYEYQVSSVDTAGNVSPRSSAVSAVIP